MKILALEFSSSARSVAIVEFSETGQRVLATMADSDFRSTTGPSLVGKALESAAIAPREVDAVAVGLGPGSYTGIRSSIAIAQGWQLALGSKLSGISTVDVLVVDAQSEELFGTVQVVIDAQRNEFYTARYELAPGKTVQVESLKIVPALDLAPTTGLTLVGPEAIESIPAMRVLPPRAVTLARLAFSRKDFVAGEKLEPIYLRPISFVKAPSPLNAK